MKHSLRSEWIAAAAPVANDFEILAAVEWIVAAAGVVAAMPRFEMHAYTGGELRLPNFPHPVVVDLAGMAATTKSRPILKDHDQKAVVGHTIAITNDRRDLRATGVISGTGAAAAEVLGNGKNGFPWQASIGARVHERDFIPPGRQVTVNGQTFDGPVIVARRTSLGEISFVALGADDNTSVSIAATHAAERKAMGFQEWLAAMGLSNDTITDEQRPMLQAKYDAEKASAKTPPADTVRASGGNDTLAGGGRDDQDPAAVALAEIRAKRGDELKRLSGLEILAEKYKGEVEPAKVTEHHEAAITAGWTADRFELELLRARRPKAPVAPMAAFSKAGDGALTGVVIEAGFCLAAGLDDVDKRFKPDVLEAADKRFKRSISLQEVLIEAAWANGYTGRSFKADPLAVQRYAFNQVQATGFSTISVSNILSNTANKFLLEGFMHVENVWQQIASTRPVNDFKQITSYRLTGSGQYETVAPAGLLKHGTLGEESFTNQADTYGLILAITRKDIINDDLGAFTAVPRKLGRGAGLKLNDVFWAPLPMPIEITRYFAAA